MVCTFNIYLTRTNNLCKAYKHLFITYISPAARRRLNYRPLLDRQDYSFCCDNLPKDSAHPFKVNAHHIRAFTVSWNALQKASLQDILHTAQWHANTTFTSFYLMDLLVIEQASSHDAEVSSSATLSWVSSLMTVKVCLVPWEIFSCSLVIGSSHFWPCSGSWISRAWRSGLFFCSGRSICHGPGKILGLWGVGMCHDNAHVLFGPFEASAAWRVIGSPLMLDLRFSQSLWLESQGF